MSGKYGTRILTKLLNIEGVKVNSYRQHQGIGIILQVELLSKESICPRCGNKSHRVHQNHRYLVKDLPLSGQAVYLEINRRQFKCDICQKPFSEELSFVRRKRNFTSRLADSIVKEVLENDIHSVAKKSHVTTEEIERMLKDKAEELLESKPCGLKRLGIDEIALIKGHGHYCAVLIDLETSKLIAILSGRTQEVIKETLEKWGTEVLEQIEEVSIDLWKGYKNLVIELMPNAQVVADRFHVMTQINKEIDTQRKTEKRSYENLIKQEKLRDQKNEYEQILSGIKNSKYSLLMYYSSLTQHGVEDSKAFKAARIMASEKPNELLTHEELRLVYDVCEIWSSMYERRQYLKSIIESISMRIEE